MIQTTNNLISLNSALHGVFDGSIALDSFLNKTNFATKYMYNARKIFFNTPTSITYVDGSNTTSYSRSMWFTGAPISVLEQYNDYTNPAVDPYRDNLTQYFTLDMFVQAVFDRKQNYAFYAQYFNINQTNNTDGFLYKYPLSVNGAYRTDGCEGNATADFSCTDWPTAVRDISISSKFDHNNLSKQN
mgnify:CR=1 FL=1